MNDLEASLRESLTSPGVESHELYESERRFSMGSEPESASDVIDKQLREMGGSQEPTPTEKEPVFDIGEA
jgi:hypothetical protein